MFVKKTEKFISISSIKRNLLKGLEASDSEKRDIQSHKFNRENCTQLSPLKHVRGKRRPMPIEKYKRKGNKAKRKKKKANIQTEMTEEGVELIKMNSAHNSDHLTDIVTMVSEVTISDVEQETKTHNRKKDPVNPILISPELRRPSSVARKVNKKKTKMSKAHKENKKFDEIKHFKEESLSELQRKVLKKSNPFPNLHGLKIQNKFPLEIFSTGKEDELSQNKDLTNQVLITTVLPPEEIQQDNTNLTLQNENSNDDDTLTKNNMTTESEEEYEINLTPPPRNEALPENFIQILEKYPSDIPNSAKHSWETYLKLKKNGCKIPFHTIQRGLMIPSDQRILKELYDKMKKNLLEEV